MSNQKRFAFSSAKNDVTSKAEQATKSISARSTLKREKSTRLFVGCTKALLYSPFPAGQPVIQLPELHTHALRSIVVYTVI
jgi:hypothetical protein